ncbi:MULTISPECIES: pyridoxal-phosphate dependent enzyme [unclassified Kitasatospora]|uniref:pyridoxal-phosphate dependent enzyme n=1 Tax=unclassified Kitasatospora TaxID=2633591 RepID=UPI0033E21B3C
MEHGGHYTVVCTRCGLRLGDDGLISACPGCRDNSLLRTEYTAGSLADAVAAAPAASGLFRYRDWLPVIREVPGASLPAVHRCRGLGAALGLSDLWMAFSGYWPERGCRMDSGTFKELEAFSVLGRVPQDAGIMVVASAGNTAAAFVRATEQFDFPCVLVVPERALPGLALAGTGPQVRIVAVKGGGYNDAITYSQGILATGAPFFPEGGVRNVARRDGLGVVMLAAYERLGRLPDYYVQAVGSGTGAIAAHEAARRIAATTGGTPPRTLLCQNTGFAPLHRLWLQERAGAAESLPSPTPVPPVAATPAPTPVSAPTPLSRPVAPSTVDVHAPELVNATPPFGVRGGVRDLLADTSGEVLLADTPAALAAAALFEETEGIDIEPAAAVAVACLRRAVAERRIPRDARILLNITGGGRRRARAEREGSAQLPNASLVGAEDDPAVTAAMLLDSLAR